MIFNSFVFLFLFLPVTYAVFWMLRSAGPRYVWLAITGYVFYGYWNPWFCLLMAFSTLVSYLAGLGFLNTETPRGRKLCLVIPIVVDLLLLAFFKYANFFMQTFNDFASWLGADVNVQQYALAAVNNVGGSLGLGWHFDRWDVTLPVGISFYTFHTITYIVDCYRGTIKPTRNLFEFSAYVSLFSQLVAGPIVRFRQIEEDLENLGAADRTRWLGIGVSFFMVGMVEKVLIADSLAPFVHKAFEPHASLTTWHAWLGVLAYTFQLLFDFSGYSSMAVGLGYMFGLRIPINFNSPYKALDPSDFWQRWHISLSTCLRDYLYIPLGGNRSGPIGTYRNLLLTMLIGGLWHGANWTFILWGAYHGALLIGHRLTASRWNAFPSTFRQLAMFFLVMIGWVLFRADNISIASTMLHTLFVPNDSGAGVFESTTALIVLLLVAAWWSMAGPNAHDINLDFRWNSLHTVFYSLAFGACLAIVAGGRNSPFLYFQF